jgi:hypothetical protein
MSVDDVSPWPQADRVNPTQGELAEDRLVVDDAAIDLNPHLASPMLS